MFDSLPATASDFYQQILGGSIFALKTKTYMDNYDAQRFSYDGVDRSALFNTPERVFYFDWFFRTHSEIYRAYSLLGNDDSRALMLYLLAYRLGGHHSVRIPVSFSTPEEDARGYFAAEKSEPSRLELGGMFGALKHFDFAFEGRHYKVDCLGLEYYLHRRQYFYESEGVRVAPETGDFVIDGGACLGDTAVVFANAVGPTGKVFAFDPVHEHLQVLAFNARQNPEFAIQPMPYGLSDEDMDGDPIHLETYAPGFNAASVQVPLRSIDSLVLSGEIPKVDFIKLDIEGFELAALRGAMATIRKFKPKLALSLYHKPNDIFELPLFIQQNFPFYRMYIEHYTIHAEETVLYCIA